MSNEDVDIWIVFSVICVTISGVILLLEIVWWGIKQRKELSALRHDNYDLQRKANRLEQENAVLNARLGYRKSHSEKEV